MWSSDSDSEIKSLQKTQQHNTIQERLFSTITKQSKKCSTIKPLSTKSLICTFSAGEQDDSDETDHISSWGTEKTSLSPPWHPLYILKVPHVVYVLPLGHHITLKPEYHGNQTNLPHNNNTNIKAVSKNNMIFKLLIPV